jgi:hypothetical protein
MYAPRLVWETLGFFATLINILFGITLAGVAGFFLVRTITVTRRVKPSRVFEKRAKASLHGGPGWTALTPTNSSNYRARKCRFVSNNRSAGA